ncbi:MAG TPA: enoyl-CoA hydratase/isomerase family protein [Thermodesulfobacteriota bacterium]
MGFRTVIFEKAGRVAHVRLNRPEALNTLNMAMRDDLSEVLAAVRDDPDVGAFVLSGAGRCFCAGADLGEFGSAPSVTAAREVRDARDNWELLRSLDKPGIAALHGPTLGAGLELALLCDLRLAAEGTTLGLPETGLGLIPAGGGTQTLIRAIPRGPAVEMLLTGKRVDAGTALAVGLVNRVVPIDALVPAALALARTVAALPGEAVRAAKAAVRDGLDLPLPHALDLERRLAARASARRRSRR